MADKIMEEIKRSQLEFSKGMEKLRISQEKADKRWEKLEEQYGKFGNFVRNDGAVVEEYFYTALDKTNELYGEKYDYFSQGEKHFLSRGVE